jgi:hypothetical protein
MKWQYNGVVPFDEIYQWCKQTIPNGFTMNGWETFTFTDEKAYGWFILRWS